MKSVKLLYESALLLVVVVVVDPNDSFNWSLPNDAFPFVLSDKLRVLRGDPMSLMRRSDFDVTVDSECDD